MKQGSTVGSNIRRVRLMHGFTQEQLALESGLSQGYINQLESGRRRYTQKTLELIAGALSVPLIEFFKGEDKRITTVSKRIEKNRKKPPNKRDFLALLKNLPDHVVEHYLTLLKMESKIWKRKT
jgi:transcriptional regulator with XRE-family HTH domain